MTKITFAPNDCPTCGTPLQLRANNVACLMCETVTWINGFRIVLTGGPCAGKSTVLAALKERLADKAAFADEAATKLFTGGHPLPTDYWTELHWIQLQRKITRLQLQHERTAELEARFCEKHLVITDRAPFDNLAYPGGAHALRELRLDGRWGRYSLVIHLPSLAVSDPERYAQTDNVARYESLEQALEQESATLMAWVDHPNRVVIEGQHSLDELIELVYELIVQRYTLSGVAVA
jgi:LSD1 subclass zinc finger protein